MGEKAPGRAALSSAGSPSSGTAQAPFPVLPACWDCWEMPEQSGCTRCHFRRAAPEGVWRSEQRRTRATRGKISLEFRAVRGGRCFPHGQPGLTFPHGSHGAAPGPGPAHTCGYSCSVVPLQQTGPGAFSKGLFQLLCRPPGFPEPLLAHQEFLPDGCAVTSKLCIQRQDRSRHEDTEMGCTSNPAAPNSPSRSQAALGADPK